MKSDLKSAIFQLNALPKVTIDSDLPRMDIPLAKANEPWHLQLQPGYALITTSGRRTFTKNQMDYLKDIFEKGRKSKKKARPNEVASQMRTEKLSSADGTETNEYRFTCAEWLCENSIRQIFSKISAEIRAGTKKKGKAKEEVSKEQVEDESNLLDAVGEAEDVDNLSNDLAELSHLDLDEQHPYKVFTEID